jgi:hypothetical protein
MARASPKSSTFTVPSGGRLIGVKGAAAWLASREVGLSAVQVSDRVGQPPAAGAEAEARVAETMPGLPPFISHRVPCYRTG